MGSRLSVYACLTITGFADAVAEGIAFVAANFVCIRRAFTLSKLSASRRAVGCVPVLAEHGRLVEPVITTPVSSWCAHRARVFYYTSERSVFETMSRFLNAWLDYAPEIGAAVGCWLGVIPAAYDWGTQWQVWAVAYTTPASQLMIVVLCGFPRNGLFVQCTLR